MSHAPLRRPHPVLLQINTQITLQELASALGRPATFDDIPDTVLDAIVAGGFDALWMLGVWETGNEGRRISRTDPSVVAEVAAHLPDYVLGDIAGSPFAIRAYQVRRAWGGDEALARWRQRLRDRGVALILDFVPNHVALDHPWLTEHAEFFVLGSARDLVERPWDYVSSVAGDRELVVAHGRDPNYPGWRDTLQLDYRHAGLHDAMTSELLDIATRCDGVRCDMAMLLLPDVVVQTWGHPERLSDGSSPTSRSFWPEAIAAARSQAPTFVFIAEVYWNRERDLHAAGFDFTYDKVLYDHLRAGQAIPIRRHLEAEPSFQRRCVRFLENHDEPRATAMFDPFARHRAAAVITSLAPGLRLFHDGQLQGRRCKTSIHASRRIEEAPDRLIESFYERLLACLDLDVVHEGVWTSLESRAAWEENPTHPAFIAFAWTLAERRLLVAVNYAPTAGQAYVPLPEPWMTTAQVDFVDRLSPRAYRRSMSTLATPGLYLALEAWDAHVFDVQPVHSGGIT